CGVHGKPASRCATDRAFNTLQGSSRNAPSSPRRKPAKSRPTHHHAGQYLIAWLWGFTTVEAPEGFVGIDGRLRPHGKGDRAVLVIADGQHRGAEGDLGIGIEGVLGLPRPG